MGKIQLSGVGDSGVLKFNPASRKLEGKAKWKDIEDLINRWAKRNRQGALDQEMWLREARDTLTDQKSGKWKQEFSGTHGKIDAETKFSILIHPELINYIQVFYPEFLSTKEELHEFMYKFPKFKIRREI